MKDFLRAVTAVAALSVGIAGAGCVTADSPNTVNTNTTATTNANVAATPSPAASPTVNANANNLPITLPVLDAMFADEAFAAELKAKLQLTDDQVNKLRSVAREETGKLRETDAEDYAGTTSAARQQADEQIKSVVGEEKAGQLAAFVRERWSGGEAGASGGGVTTTGAMTGKPNAVPGDTRVVVNAPAYRMDVFENGQLVKTYKVGIGYPEFPLPTGQRRADTIIFNPTWTPPDEPWVEAPSSKVKVGEKVEAGSPLNPLGPVKIPIGLPSLIHGGKTPAKLGTFASHGCVGLTNQQVQDFAQVLGKLGGTQITPEDVANYAKTKTETKNVKLNNAVPVELRYETIVVSDGKLSIYRDVYDRGTNTEENLRAALEAQGVSLDQLSEAERGQAMNALKEMARDASGKPADGQPSASPGANANAGGNTNGNSNRNASAADEKITRTIKGRKEIVIPIAALSGKGYPAPVGADMGGKSAAGKKR